LIDYRWFAGGLVVLGGRSFAPDSIKRRMFVDYNRRLPRAAWSLTPRYARYAFCFAFAD